MSSTSPENPDHLEPVASSAGSFDEGQQLMLAMLPTIVGSAVAFSSKNGPVGTVKEMMANAKAAAAGVQQYPDNKIIASIIPHFDDRAEAMEAAKAMRDQQVERLKSAGITSKEEMRTHAISEAASVNELLNTSAEANEASEYRQWVMGVAEAVANAAKEGGFLGVGGEQVGEGEAQTLTEIRSALGL